MALGTEPRRRFDVEVIRDVRIPMTDPGVTLSGDAFLPVGVRSAPALVTLLPYRKDLGASTKLVSAFATRGYASVIVDVRGTGSSDGMRRGVFDPGDADDGAAAIEWIARQPWCSGDVGLWGHSYGAAMTLSTASRRPPSLKAIMPVQGPADPEREGFFPDGARVDLKQMVAWGGHVLAMQLLPPLVNAASAHEQRRWHERMHSVEPVIVDLARCGVGHPVWRERATDAASITAPALCVGGWRDLYVHASVAAYEALAGPKRLVMGPWGHEWPSDVDLTEIAVRWWDHWLRGVDNGVIDEPPVVLFSEGASPTWIALDAWPPPAESLVLATGGDTTLVEPPPPADTRPRAIASYEPNPTIGLLGGPNGLFGAPVGWALDHRDERDSASFTSGATSGELTICGRPVVTVRLTASDIGAPLAVRRLVVRLAAVDEEGRTAFVTGGVLCPAEPIDAHRIELRPIAWRLAAGHRLRVLLSDADFPRLTPVADPVPFSISAVELALPVLAECAAAPVELPTIGEPSNRSLVPFSARRPELFDRWLVTRDLVHDGVEMALRATQPSVVTSDGHIVDFQLELQAAVRRAAPASASACGTASYLVRAATGEAIAVRAVVRCTQTTLWARGEVEVDGAAVYTRTWEALLDEPGQMAR